MIHSNSAIELSFYHYDRLCSLLEVPLDRYLELRNALIDKDLIAFDGTRFQVLALPPSPRFEARPALRTAEDLTRRDPATVRQRSTPTTAEPPGRLAPRAADPHEPDDGTRPQLDHDPGGEAGAGARMQPPSGSGLPAQVDLAYAGAVGMPPSHTRLGSNALSNLCYGRTVRSSGRPSAAWPELANFLLPDDPLVRRRTRGIRSCGGAFVWRLVPFLLLAGACATTSLSVEREPRRASPGPLKEGDYVYAAQRLTDQGGGPDRLPYDREVKAAVRNNSAAIASHFRTQIMALVSSVEWESKGSSGQDTQSVFLSCASAVLHPENSIVESGGETYLLSRSPRDLGFMEAGMGFQEAQRACQRAALAPGEENAPAVEDLGAHSADASEPSTPASWELVPRIGAGVTTGVLGVGVEASRRLVEPTADDPGFALGLGVGTGSYSIGGGLTAYALVSPSFRLYFSAGAAWSNSYLFPTRLKPGIAIRVALLGFDVRVVQGWSLKVGAGFAYNVGNTWNRGGGLDIDLTVGRVLDL